MTEVSGDRAEQRFRIVPSLGVAVKEERGYKLPALAAMLRDSVCDGTFACTSNGCKKEYILHVVLSHVFHP